MGDARNQLAYRCHLLGVHEFGLQHGRVGDVGHYHHDAGDGPLLITHGAEIDGKLAQPAVATVDLQVKIVYLMTGHGGIESIA